MSLRLLSLPISAAAQVALTHLVIEDRGPRIYAEFALTWTFTQFLAFADLGMGVGLVNSVSRAQSANAPDVVRVTCALIQRLIAVASIIIAIAWVNAWLGGWDFLLGPHGRSYSLSGVNAMTAEFISVFALSLPIGIWQRVLVGLGRNDLVLASNLSGTIVAFVAAALTIALKLPNGCLILAPAIGVLCGNVIALILARHFGGARPGRIYLLAFSSRPRVTLRAYVLPLVVINFAQPIAVASDRYIISWERTVGDVAAYSLASQLYAPLLSVLTFGGASLWPKYVEVGVDRRGMLQRDLMRFMAFGLLLAIPLTVLGPLAGRLVSSGQVASSTSLYLSFGALLMAQSFALPFAMSLMQEGNLKFQAGAVAMMSVGNLAASIPLARWSVCGPVVASAVSIAVLQGVPLSRRSLRTHDGALQRGREFV